MQAKRKLLYFEIRISFSSWQKHILFYHNFLYSHINESIWQIRNLANGFIDALFPIKTLKPYKVNKKRPLKSYEKGAQYG